jgi:hypothetical protein
VPSALDDNPKAVERVAARSTPFNSLLYLRGGALGPGARIG